MYWVPVFEVLDRAGFEVHLVNPRATKQVSGRKSDVLDCQWIRQLMSYGLLRGAFRSPDALCPMRSYVRQRGHRRRLARMDSAKAVKATAHQLARLIYAMLTRGEQYVERDLATMETQRRDRQIKNLQRQARHFDLALVPAEQAA